VWRVLCTCACVPVRARLHTMSVHGYLWVYCVSVLSLTASKVTRVQASLDLAMRNLKDARAYTRAFSLTRQCTPCSILSLVRHRISSSPAHTLCAAHCLTSVQLITRPCKKLTKPRACAQKRSI